MLGQRGYVSANGGNADRFDYFETTVLYTPGSTDAELAADELAELFVDAKVEEAPADVPLETTVRVIVGQTFHGTPRRGAGRPRRRGRSPRSRPTRRPRRPSRRLCAASTSPVLAPSVIETGAHISTLEGVRAYRLNGEQAVRVTYQSPDGIEYWGIQQTAWTDAPALDGASVTKTIEGASTSSSSAAPASISSRSRRTAPPIGS